MPVRKALLVLLVTVIALFVMIVWGLSALLRHADGLSLR